MSKEFSKETVKLAIDEKNIIKERIFKALLCGEVIIKDTGSVSFEGLDFYVVKGPQTVDITISEKENSKTCIKVTLSTYKETTEVVGIDYLENSKRHRLYSPASFRYDLNGVPINVEYWINGKIYSEKKFNEMMDSSLARDLNHGANEQGKLSTLRQHSGGVVSSVRNKYDLVDKYFK